MLPLKLTLRGFKGIEAGIGRDEVTIDFEGIPGSLVAIWGPNGSGKSTILDNMHPYRLMPSRASGWSPSSFSFYEHIGAEAERTIIWSHAGVTYRSRLTFKQTAKTKSQSCFLARREGGDWESMNDGKTATYDEAVNAILGSPELFFTAAFASQSRPLVTSYGNASVKELLAELLRQDEIAEMHERAKGKASEAVARVTGIQKSAADLEDASERLRSVLSRMENLEAEERDGAHLLASTELESQKIRDKLAAARADAGDISRWQSQVTEAESAVASAKESVERVESTHMVRVSSVSNEHQERLEALLKKRREAEAAEEKARSAYEKTKSMVDNASQCIEGNERWHEAKKSLQAAEEVLAIERGKLHEHASWCAQDRKLRSDVENLQGRVRHTAAALKEKEQAFGLVDEVPCSDQPALVSACPLLEAARGAGERAAEFRDELESLQEDLVNAEALVEAHVKKEPENGCVGEAEESVMDWKKVVETHSAYSDDNVQEFRFAEQVLPERMESLASASSLAREYAEELDKVRAAHEAKLKSLEGERESNKAAAMAVLGSAEKRLEGILGERPDESKVKTIESELERNQCKLAEARSKRDDAVRNLGVLSAERESLDDEVERLSVATACLQEAEDDAANWNILLKALSRDGILALAIDDVGPTIAGLANDILLECFGPRYTVGITTLQETAKGSQKEVFELTVFDSETNDAKSVSVMSGGQKVYINEAITRAMMLFNAQHNGISTECLFADEADGALDPEKKLEFASMKRKVMELSGAEREFFVSHSESVTDVADHVIHMEKLR